MIDYLPDLLIIIYSGLLGLLIASFLNVVIYRLPQGETIVQGRSHCMSCGHALGALDLLPMFSYLLLGRRCRYCREPISSRYIKIELAGGVFFALAAWVNRPYTNLSSVLSLMVICALFCLLLVDSMIRFDRHKLTPPAIIFASLILAAFPLVQSLAANTLDGVEIANRLSGLIDNSLAEFIATGRHRQVTACFSFACRWTLAGLAADAAGILAFCCRYLVSEEATPGAIVQLRFVFACCFTVSGYI